MMRGAVFLGLVLSSSLGAAPVPKPKLGPPRPPAERCTFTSHYTSFPSVVYVGWFRPDGTYELRWVREALPDGSPRPLYTGWWCLEGDKLIVWEHAVGVRSGWNSHRKCVYSWNGQIWKDESYSIRPYPPPP